MTPASKLEGIKPGDRVRVTFEGYIRTLNEDWIGIDIVCGDGGECVFSSDDIEGEFDLERIP